MYERLTGAIRAAANAWRAPGGYREAVGVTIDDDEDEWRPLTGNARRDLSPLTQRRMQDLALYLWETNLLANRLIELPVAYLLAEGVKLTVKDEDAQGWLDSFWCDPINCMNIKLPRKVREMALFGEQFWPAFTNEMSGHVRLGYLDPALVATVVADPDNAEQPIGVVTVRNKRGVARRFRVIVNGPEDVFTERTREIRQSFTDGELFYSAINTLSNGRRGRSDLLAQIDWADAYERFLFGEIDRANFMRAFLWDVTLKGATPEEVEARAKKIVAPKPGSVRVHNDAEEWAAVTPDLKAQDSARAARLFRNHILGGGTLPEHWFGGAGDVNLATAQEMGAPTFKMMSMRQLTWRHILEEVATFVINRRLDPTGASTIEPGDPELTPTAVFPELTTEDTTKYATALQQVTVAAVMAIDRGMISELTAVAMVQAVAGRLGVEFDAETELEAARADVERRAEEDTIVVPGEDDDETPE